MFHRKINIIFLDIDGVLNGNSPIRYIISRIFKFFRLKRLSKWMWFDYTYSIHKNKIRKLAVICKYTKAKIVLTSSWRDKVNNSYFNGIDKNKLANLLSYYFKKYNIPLIGITDHSLDSRRDKEILNWLAKNERIVNKYIILDDELQDSDIFEKELILTSNPDIQGRWYCKEGLRWKHVIKAIDKLGINYL